MDFILGELKSHICGRQNNWPFKCAHALILGTCEDVTLLGKRDFADVIAVIETLK